MRPRQPPVPRFSCRTSAPIVVATSLLMKSHETGGRYNPPAAWMVRSGEPPAASASCGLRVRTRNRATLTTYEIAQYNSHSRGTQVKGPAAAATVAPGTRSGAPGNRWSVLALLGVAQLMIVLDVTIVNIALPSAQHALHFSTDDRQWIITAYALSFGSLLLLGGKLGDLLGRSGRSSPDC